MRNSTQRNLVYDIIQASCDHPTADMVYLRAKEVLPKISLGTVYRNLNELVELGKVLRISVPGDSDRFDKTIFKHTHFFCEKCKSIIDIDEIKIDDVVTKIEKEKKLKVFTNQISLYGICSKCQK